MKVIKTSLAHEGSGYSVFRTELLVGIVGVYGIGSDTSDPYIHELLLHTYTIFKPYPSLKALKAICSMNDIVYC